MCDSLRGKFLIACKKLRDPNFYKTVVLIVEHGDEGAMGLVVNRPSSVTVAHALSDYFKLPETDDLVYVGGPVEPASLFIIHNSNELDEDEKCIVPGVFVGSSPGVFERVVRCAVEEQHDMQYRIFCGCAGWAPNQLEGELGRGDWHLHPANASDIFQLDPYVIWDSLRKAAGDACSYLPTKPPYNPEWN